MQKNKLPIPITILILTLVTAIFWIIFEVARTFIKEPRPAVPRAITQPLNPNLDAEVLAQLQQRLELSDAEIGNVTIIAQTPTPEPTPVATPEALLEEEATQEAEATEEGTIINETL